MQSPYSESTQTGDNLAKTPAKPRYLATFAHVSLMSALYPHLILVILLANLAVYSSAYHVNKNHKSSQS